jgi:hypothetical protein
MGLCIVKKFFLPLTFYESILSLSQVYFFEIGIKFLFFLYGILDIFFKEKNFHLRKIILYIFGRLKIQDSVFHNRILKIFDLPKTIVFKITVT